METPTGKCRNRLDQLTPSVKLTSNSEISPHNLFIATRKTLFTPCRRVGLKRKSNCVNSPEVKEPRVLFKDKKSYDSHCTTKHLSPKEKTFAVGKVQHATNFYKSEKLLVLSPPCLQSNTFQESNLKSVCEKIWKGQSKNCSSDCKSNIVTMQELEIISQRIKEKRKKISHSELSKLYEKKHDVNLLMELIFKWKKGCQEVLHDLRTVLNDKGHELTMLQLLAQFQIKHDIIGFNNDSDEFE